MSDELEPIIDKSGQIRRCGTLTVPPNFVSAFPAFDTAGRIYNDDEIKRLISDPSRIPSRITYDSSWTLDQHQFGSCQGHGCASALARARYKRGLSKLLLSGAYAYSKVNGGRDNGSALEDGLRAVSQYGICPLDLVPYNQIYANLQPKSADAEAAKHKGLLAFAITGASAAEKRQGLRSALAAGWPCVVAVSVGSRFDTLRNGICGVDGGVGNHAVCVDDLRIVNGTEVFDMNNSWGTSFGEMGRGYLVWDHFVQTIGNHTFYAIASTTEAGE